MFYTIINWWRNYWFRNTIINRVTLLYLTSWRIFKNLSSLIYSFQSYLRQLNKLFWLHFTFYFLFCNFNFLFYSFYFLFCWIYLLSITFDWFPSLLSNKICYLYFRKFLEIDIGLFALWDRHLTKSSISTYN